MLVGALAAKPRERVAGGGAREQRHELEGHEPAGGVLGVAREPAQVALALVRLQRQELLGELLGQVGEQVGGHVGVELLEHLGGARHGHLGERRGAQLLVHLLQGVGGEVGVQRTEHGGALARPDLADDVGDVGRDAARRARRRPRRS